MIGDTDRLQFIGVDAGVRELLKRFKSIVHSEIEPILDRFYGNIRRFPDAWNFIGSEARIPSLISAQKQHWLQLFEAEFDDSYFDSVRRVGLAHVRIGLEPNWYLGAYGYIVQFAPPVYGALYWRRATREGALAGLVGGVGVNCYYQLFADGTPLDINAGMVALIVNIVVFVGISLLVRQSDEIRARSAAFVET